MNLRNTTGLAAAVLLTMAAGAVSAQAADIETPMSDLWSGFYVGAQAGYLQGTGSDTDLCVKTNVDGDGPQSGCLGNGGLEGPTDFSLGDNDMDGVTAGGYLGYNYRIDSIVLGLEGDFNWDNADGSNSILGGLNYDTSINWDASVRARLGFVVDERALLYVTGGPSWLNTELDSNLCSLVKSEGGAGVNTSCGDSNTEFGWQLGAGAEFAMTEHLSIKAEYLHGWYGDADQDMVKLSQGGQYIKYQLKQDLQTNVVRVGVAYHFGGL
jgi:outer membrane immunogenic protein